MKTLLVTGGCDFIGGHFVRLILHERPDCRVVMQTCLLTRAILKISVSSRASAVKIVQQVLISRSMGTTHHWTNVIVPMTVAAVHQTDGRAVFECLALDHPVENKKSRRKKYHIEPDQKPNPRERLLAFSSAKENAH